jgi:hypothetical protein
MFEFIAFVIALVVAGAAAFYGHTRSRDFSRRRLRYTRVAEMPGIVGVLAGVGTALLAAPVVAFLPIVGAGTAMALGAGVGTGVAMGSRDGVA